MRHPAVAVFLSQTAISAAVVIIGYVFEGFTFAFSAAVGCGVAIVPQGLFGFWAFRNRGARNARLIARNLFIGEGLKLGMTVLLFTVVWLSFKQLDTFAVFVGFVTTVLVGQLSIPLVLGGTRKY
ncbi:MAG TPA: hypothetical protein DEF72_08455 [Gammaproteobacteria bacterium]|nr:hypothetical protein [Gammaproteobacteria bacterium]